MKISTHNFKKTFSTVANLFICFSLIFSTSLFFPKYAKSAQISKPVSTKFDKKILFIGNSFTYVNDLPSMFQKLSKAGGFNVYIDKILPSGYTFAKQSDTNDKYGKITVSKIKSNKWDYVILQEQSQYPAYSNLREIMYKSAQSLCNLIKNVKATPLYFETWGYKNGDIQNSNVTETQTFEGMQNQLKIGYNEACKLTGGLIAPVGDAWLNAWKSDNSINLWGPDNKHPALKGTYLAACVFYSTIFHKSPIGLKFYGGLTPKEALSLQKTAWTTCQSN